MLERLLPQLAFSRGSGLAHRRANAATGRGDLFVTCSARALLEFIDPVSREHRMRMRVDESRQDHAPTGIDRPPRRSAAAFRLHPKAPWRQSRHQSPTSRRPE